MDTHEDTARRKAGVHWSAWVVGAVLLGLAVGTVAGLRLAASAPVGNQRVEAARTMPSPGRAATAARAAAPPIVERLDHSVVNAGSADSTPEEPGASIAAYGP